MSPELSYSWHSPTASFSPAIFDAVRARRILSPTPFLLVDPAPALAIATELETTLGEVRYAVKAGPHLPLLHALGKAGFGFDVASINELLLVVEAGAVPESIIASNPAMPLSDITAVLAFGVRHFVVDAISHLQVILRLAQASSIAPDELRILIRLNYSDHSAHYPLATKFGIDESAAAVLAGEVRASGATLAGVAFHLGSQATSIDAASDAAARSLAFVRGLAIESAIVDVGGGFPAPYSGAPDWREFTKALAGPLRGNVRVYCEPGRLLASAGSVMAATVISVAERSGRRYVHLDAGGYHGLMEFSGMLGTAFSVGVGTLTQDAPGPLSLTHLVGPTCDALDVIFANPVVMPNVSIGDIVLFDRAGAYSTSVSSPFNGFAVPQDYPATDMLILQ
jgi:ornithine decarboxylase